MIGGNACTANPQSSLNEITDRINNRLTSAIGAAGVILDRLYGCEKTVEACEKSAEPDNLEARLIFADLALNKLNSKLEAIIVRL
jgi:hypothetical protein